jgi:hypothetical protein
MKVMKFIAIVIIILGTVNCLIGFTDGNPLSAMGWLVAVIGWIIILMKEIKSDYD